MTHENNYTNLSALLDKSFYSLKFVIVNIPVS
jgi:hypothetical protein